MELPKRIYNYDSNSGWHMGTQSIQLCISYMGPIWAPHCIHLGQPIWAPHGAMLHPLYGSHMGSPYGTHIETHVGPIWVPYTLFAGGMFHLNIKKVILYLHNRSQIPKPDSYIVLQYRYHRWNRTGCSLQWNTCQCSRSRIYTASFWFLHHTWQYTRSMADTCRTPPRHIVLENKNVTKSKSTKM